MQLRPYQQDAHDAFFNYFYNGGRGNPLIVAPTGAGKSHIIAAICRTILKDWPGTRVLVAARSKEILRQNTQKIHAAWPAAPLAIFSASLGSRRVGALTMGQVQTIFRKTDTLGHFDVVIADECHQIPKKGMGQYVQLFEGLKANNANLKVLGLTATPYRLDSGMLHEGDGALFTDIVYDIPIDLLIAEGHLVPPISKSSKVQADLSAVRVRGGEFLRADVTAAFDRQELTAAAVADMYDKASDRQAWLIFASSVAHAHHVAEAISAKGRSTAIIHGKTEPAERDSLIKSFTAGEIQALVNVDVLTTGFDSPVCDMVALLRSTKSAALYVQMIGRGMRPYTGKDSCLVLDYGGNVERHGPVNKIRVRPGKVAGESSEIVAPPTKTCPNCDSVMLIGMARCADCGHEFPASSPHAPTASDAAPYTPKLPPQPQAFKVDHIKYSYHTPKQKKGKEPIPSMRVDYHCGMQTFSDWICVQHTNNRALRRAQDWWRKHSEAPEKEIPRTASEAVTRAHHGELREPWQVWIKEDEKTGFMRIASINFPTEEQAVAREALIDEMIEEGVI